MPLLTTKVHLDYGSRALLETAGETGYGIGQATMRDRPYFSPTWEYLKRSPSDLQWLRERYPEFTEGDREPSDSLSQFDLVATAVYIASGITDAIVHWTIASEAAERLARTLHHDRAGREALAEAAGVDLDVFDQRVRDGWRHAHFMGSFPDWQGAANLLVYGSETPPQEATQPN
jgi:hypothetical protein